MSNNAMNYQFDFYYEKYNDANQKVTSIVPEKR